ncbi:uncharacterized protein [Panulirus ornatus]|uniref:uncharacterized protein isoform X2 n=1 Tax=Panulirus ornatus TaxID=150431 RepID=UPI003A853717
MRVLLGAAVLLVATMSVLASEYHVEDANGLLDRFEAPTHRQIDYDYREGIELQPQDDIGFFQGNRPKRRPNRRPGRIPHRRPSIRGRRRPQKQLVPKRESTDDGPAAGGIVRATNGGRGKTNGNRSQEEGISGFLKSFRRLIHRVI